MGKSSIGIDQILTLLDEAPGRIADLTGGLPPDVVQAPPGAGQWSINDILAHLRSCADIWGECIVTIASADEPPTLRAVNPTTWIEETDYREQKFRPSLKLFIAQRKDLLAFLEPLPDDAWWRTATLTGAGKPLQRNVISYAQRLAEHERSHVKHIGRLVKSLGS